MSGLINGLLQRESLPVLEAAMGFAHHRQLAIMNNIANVDTPEFKRRVLPEEGFKQCLEDAIAERYRSHWNEFRVRDGMDVRFSGTYPVPRFPEGRDWGPMRHDESNVVIEKEMVDLAKNSMFMETLQKLFKSKTSGIKAALRTGSA